MYWAGYLLKAYQCFCYICFVVLIEYQQMCREEEEAFPLVIPKVEVAQHWLDLQTADKVSVPKDVKML